jgi:hypothetical protein
MTPESPIADMERFRSFRDS